MQMTKKGQSLEILEVITALKRKGCPSKDHNKVVARLKMKLILIPILKNLIQSCSISDSLFDDLDLVT